MYLSTPLQVIIHTFQQQQKYTNFVVALDVLFFFFFFVTILKKLAPMIKELLSEEMQKILIDERGRKFEYVKKFENTGPWSSMSEISNRLIADCLVFDVLIRKRKMIEANDIE